VPHSIAVTGCPTADPVTPPTDPVAPPADPVLPEPQPPQRTSAIGVSTAVKGKKINADGQVAPAPNGGQVRLELLRKQGHDFASVKSASVPLDPSGGFKTTFKNPKHTRRCELIVTFAGDGALLPSEATQKFRC
jgi:hypothetical protein